MGMSAPSPHLTLTSLSFLGVPTDLSTKVEATELDGGRTEKKIQGLWRRWNRQAGRQADSSQTETNRQQAGRQTGRKTSKHTETQTDFGQIGRQERQSAGREANKQRQTADRQADRQTGTQADRSHLLGRQTEKQADRLGLEAWHSLPCNCGLETYFLAC